jgi:hypothetical protein
LSIGRVVSWSYVFDKVSFSRIMLQAWSRESGGGATKM